jgi:uncharacterized membrane protein YtjA (UPF0391 family)
MVHYATIFLSVGLIAGGLNVLGLATLVTQGAWTLLLSGVVLVIINRVAERTDRVSSPIRSIVSVHP